MVSWGLWGRAARGLYLRRAVEGVLVNGAYKPCHAIKRREPTQKAITKCFCPLITISATNVV